MGVWLVPKGEGLAKTASWYGFRLDASNARWAFASAKPFRSIAALELFATLLSIVAFDLGGDQEALLQLTGDIDNSGNAFVVFKMMTTKWPLAAILMEVAVQLRISSISMDLGCVPRLQNEEATL